MEANRTILLTLGQMARQLRVNSAWLRAEAAAGRVPALKAGERFLFSPSAVEAALELRAKRPAFSKPEVAQ